MKMAKFSTRNPVTVAMVVLAVVILGLLSYTKLKVDLMPNIVAPHIVVQTTMENTGPEEMENLISRPIEEAVARVNNVSKISSSSMQSISMVDIEFNWRTNIDVAANDARARIDRIRDTLPTEAKTPVVWKIDTSNKPIIILALTGNKDLRELRRIAEEVVQDRLEQVPGVGSVDLDGGFQREISVKVDQGRLQAYGLSLKQVSDRLAQENVDSSGGFATEGKAEYLVRTLARFASLTDIQDAILIAANGVPVRMKDIATVEDSHKEARILASLDKQVAVGLNVRKQPDANTLDVINDSKKALQKIQQEYPDVTVTITYDQGNYIKNSVMNVQENAIIGGILAILVIYLFLRSARSTFIVALSIPISLIATFMMFQFKGLTINLMSLGGLALGVGMIVDDAIVVIENIYRHLQQQKFIWQAVDDATAEIGGAVISTTITVMVVFLPISFAEGMSGMLFAEFALAVVFSIGVSLVMALTVVPCLATQLLEPAATNAPTTSPGTITIMLDKALGLWDQLFNYLEAKYRTILTIALNHPRKVILMAVSTLAISLALLPLVGTELMPVTDSGNFTIYVKTPIGTAFDKTNQSFAQVEQVLQQTPEIATEYAVVGKILKFGSRPAPNVGYISVTLTDKNTRTKNTQDVIKELRSKLNNIPGVSIRFAVTDLITQLLTANKSPIEIKIFGPDIKQLSLLTEQTEKLMKQVSGIRDVNIEVDDASPELQITIDRTKSSQYGLSTASIAGQIRTAIGGTTATRYNLATAKNEIDIIVQLLEQQRKTPADIYNTNISLPNGQTVLLKDIALVEKQTGPNVLTRENRSRMILLSANAFDRDKGSIAKDLQTRMAEIPLPPGYSIRVGGDQEEMQSSFSSLALSLGLAILLVYMVLASQFESLTHPLAIMLSLPLSVVGVVLALLITGKAFGLTAFIGLIMLVGIVVKNAILLVDYTNTLRSSGLDRKEALMTAGPVRLRPILMTTIATVLGMIPIALGIGTSSEANAPMAIAVIGGLMTSTILTLVVVPVAYTYVDAWETKTTWLKRLPQKILNIKN
ncbi:efflux RND transporter permease subunit [Pelosinus sp. IPA-1]|uniref:efflux RND transporter permease subunit n=1 Tax=Pelosinus sp. IPA-1 TaxID=3029569 RepID=UPI0024361AAE|nr:efflux RND transporter permease subunit [Pelosinus sp. IPA-1]GMB00975.1 multidrug ABC transporter [Pelosinus sp. IPA-1]